MPNSPSSPIQQIPLEQMERGLARPVATLKLEPAEITTRLGVQFETTRDDLDELEAAVICSNTGRQFALVRHRHQPEPGTDILINERSRNLTADLRGALRVLHFGPQELRWTHPRINAKSLRQVLPSSLAKMIEKTLKAAGTQKITASEILARLKGAETHGHSVGEIVREFEISDKDAVNSFVLAKRSNSRLRKVAKKTKKAA